MLLVKIAQLDLQCRDVGKIACKKVGVHHKALSIAVHSDVFATICSRIGKINLLVPTAKI